MKGKFGKNYDPNFAAKQAYLKEKFGASYDPSKVKSNAKTRKAPITNSPPPTKGYQGKNFDPDYLKKKLGDKYDPSRGPKS